MKRVLIVDDEERIVDGLIRTIHRSPVEAVVSSARNGREALDRLSDDGADVVITDVRMPRMDGIELLTRLKANAATQHIPVIMLTGNDEDTVRRSALNLGAFDFLIKPADPAELTARLNNALRIKSYQDQLRGRNDLLEAQLQRLQQLENTALLAAGIVHDLNNALGCAVGNAEILQFGLTTDAKTQERLDALQQGLTQMQELIGGIHQLNRRGDSAETDCNLGRLVTDTLNTLKVIVKERIELEWDEPAQLCLVQGRAAELRQLVMNLCVNAIQAIENKGVIRVTLSSERLADDPPKALRHLTPGVYVRLSVADTGCGIATDIAERIFEPFFTTKSESNGTGLGLSVVARTLETHAGGVAVESTPGAGSTFSVYLPHANAAEDSGQTEGATSHAGKAEHLVRG
jgi:signal transduction histidine kinase